MRNTHDAQGDGVWPQPCYVVTDAPYLSTDRGPVMSNYPTHHSSSALNTMSMIPEASHYPSDPRYDHVYKNAINPGTVSISRHSNIHNNNRTGDRQSLMSQSMQTSQPNWNPSIMTGLDPIEPFVRVPD